ncbi:indolepyruvate ferredoxin oxidoreductase family protein [Kordiimonas pumila]|uniref:Indolepyruvate ferredoxin oxidoreductase family protein n=1 Tax=Kordiimonas pumila TaxID=2161677 RepID=A0ABV7D1B2_9PROT|nr:indolepyruvate ferredoxin oxidoreductase family protein [Kordiimonas pumila]
MTKKISLTDRYTLKEGHTFMNGIHALVRLPIVQKWRDEKDGLNTAGFISGYRGSPLGVYDLELYKQRKLLEKNSIKFEPGLNEDLAATAVWGTQMLEINKKDALYDGVFGIWYGKNPGLDRSMDVVKHGNAAGTSPHGGVLCIAGDDHGAKSSTIPHQSDHNFMAAFMPELYPASVQEFVEYGLLGIAMSRYSGTWVGFKATGETVETTCTVDLSCEQREIIIPTDFEMPEGGLNIRWPDVWREQDWRLQRYKGFAAQAFARANKIDQIIWDCPKPKFGIITSGKSYQDVRQALYELGITREVATEIGLRLYKVGMPWPLEPQGVRRFCEGLDEVLVVEEKREMIEHQLRWQLYNWKPNVRPTVVGKHDENDEWLLPPENELDVGMIAQAIAARMAKLYQNADIQKKLDYFSNRKRASIGYTPAINRVPYFCSGCPHNSSTKVPEGSRATAGIGCHIMAMNMDRSTETYTHMGGEGVPWVGQAPFTKEKHIFANMGDGTYMHSGLLAIRQAVIANVNMTYKILFNDAVAMTGGQHVEGNLTVPQICAQLKAEGVAKVVVVTDKPANYTLLNLPAKTDIYHRDMLMQVQNELKNTKGVTAIIYDQTCAAEKRRRRKRGLMPDPDHRIFINDAVCEGCGDCSVQSNCIAIEPLETALGRKRRINQSSCNKDYSCIKGFCPSFVSVRGGASPRKSKAGTGELKTLGLPDLPQPSIPAFDPVYNDYNILVTGIGGTGVLTIGSILGMASYLDGKESSVLDMMGLAQKGGSVLSHVRLSSSSDRLRSSRIVTGRAHVLLACDSIVAASKDAANILDVEKTSAVINSNLTPIADFVRNQDIDFKQAAIEGQLDAVTRHDSRYRVPAQEIAAALMGDSIATNTFMLGYAWQKGLIPLSLESIEEAIRLNGVAIDINLRTLFWGRMTAHDEASVIKMLKGSIAEQPIIPRTLEEVIDHRSKHLTTYQNAKLAQKYQALVSNVREAEAVYHGDTTLTKAVAINYAKLLSYKDEYEVARLYSGKDFKSKLKAQFHGKMNISIHMAPPIFPGKDKATGRPQKREFGAWIFPALNILSKLKGLRGTAFDPFGYSHERRQERTLIAEYEEMINWIVANLTKEKLSLAIELAATPDMIRGFGPVKDSNIQKAAEQKQRLLACWHSPNMDKAAAE